MFKYHYNDGKVENLIDKKEEIRDFISSSFIKEVLNIKEFIPVEVNESYELDKFAFEYYQDYNKWWIIGLYNNIINPFEEFQETRTIKIPLLMEIDNCISNTISNKELN
jgi:hypothetical protein